MAVCLEDGLMNIWHTHSSHSSRPAREARLHLLDPLSRRCASPAQTRRSYTRSTGLGAWDVFRVAAMVTLPRSMMQSRPFDGFGLMMLPATTGGVYMLSRLVLRSKGTDS